MTWHKLPEYEDSGYIFASAWKNFHWSFTILYICQITNGFSAQSDFEILWYDHIRFSSNFLLFHSSLFSFRPIIFSEIFRFASCPKSSVWLKLYFSLDQRRLMFTLSFHFIAWQKWWTTDMTNDKITYLIARDKRSIQIWLSLSQLHLDRPEQEWSKSSRWS